MFRCLRLLNNGAHFIEWIGAIAPFQKAPLKPRPIKPTDCPIGSDNQISPPQPVRIHLLACFSVVKSPVIHHCSLPFLGLFWPPSLIRQTKHSICCYLSIPIRIRASLQLRNYSVTTDGMLVIPRALVRFRSGIARLNKSLSTQHQSIPAIGTVQIGDRPASNCFK